MRILYDMVHPADVHFFRHAIEQQGARNDQIAVTSRDKDIALLLLDRLGIAHRALTGRGNGLWGLAVELLRRNAGLLRFAREFRPDILVANNSPCAAHVGRLLGRPSLIFDDTEIHRLNRWLYRPFATEVHYPESFTRKTRGNAPRYPSYHVLAYLHPNHFTPDPGVIRDMGLDPKRKRVFVRFVAHGAAHDLGRADLRHTDQRRIVATLSKTAEVLVSSEQPLPDELKPYLVPCPPERIHHVLAFSDLVVGESATMCAEAAVLGTPAIYIDTETRGYIEDLTRRYRLCFRWAPDQLTPMLEQALAILAADGPDAALHAARERMLAEHIDASSYQSAQIDRIVEEHRVKRRTAQADRPT